MSVDNKASIEPNISPYVLVGDSPIMYEDPDGNFRWPAGKVAEYSMKYPQLTKYLMNHAEQDYMGGSVFGNGPMNAARFVASRFGGGEMSDEEMRSSIFTWGGNSLIIEAGAQTMYNPPAEIVKALGEQNDDFFMDMEGERVILNQGFMERIEGILASDVSNEVKQLAVLEFFLLLGHEGVGHKLEIKDGSIDTEGGYLWESQATRMNPNRYGEEVLFQGKDRGYEVIKWLRLRNKLNNGPDETLPTIPE
jgi:hypothetical protein